MVTVRVQLAPQTLLGVYMAAHRGGEWVTPSDLQKEGESPVVYSSMHGHAAYESEGMNGSNKTSIDLGIGTPAFEPQGHGGGDPIHRLPLPVSDHRLMAIKTDIYTCL